MGKKDINKIYEQIAKMHDKLDDIKKQECRVSSIRDFMTERENNPKVQYLEICDTPGADAQFRIRLTPHDLKGVLEYLKISETTESEIKAIELRNMCADLIDYVKKL